MKRFSSVLSCRVVPPGLIFVLLVLLPAPSLLPAAAPVLIKQTPLPDKLHGWTSPNAEYYAEVEYEPGNPEYVPIARFVLRHRSGRQLYAKAHPGHTLLDIANNGAVVGIDFDGPISGRAKLHFYDLAGQEQGTADIGFLNQRLFAGAGQPEQGRYLVLDGLCGLRVFDLRGREEFNLGRGNSFAASADGSLIALARDDAVFVFRDSERLAHFALSSPFVRQLKFSPDGTLLGLIDRKRLTLYRLPDAQLVFEYLEPLPERNFISLDIAPGSNLVLAGLDEDYGRGSGARHQRGLVYGFNTSGMKIWQEAISYQRWHSFAPLVSFVSDQTFRVRTAEEELEYRYQKEEQ